MNGRLLAYALTAGLAASDGAAFLAVWHVAHAMRRSFDAHFQNPINAFEPFYAQAAGPYLSLWFGILIAYGHYAHRRRISSLNELRRVLQTSWVLLLGMPALAWMLKEYDLGRSVVLVAWAMLCLYLYVSRTALRMAKRALVRRGVGRIRVLIAGCGETGGRVARSIAEHPEVGYEIVGFVRVRPAKPGDALAPEAVLGEIGDLRRIAVESNAEEVFLADPELSKDELLNLVVELEDLRITVKTVYNFLEVVKSEFREEEMADFPVMNMRDGRLSLGHAAAKRALDYFVLAISAPVWAPLFLGIVVYLRITQGAPIFFMHERVGKDERRFRLIKFRTMRPDTAAQAPAPTEAADPRITPAGRWLRRTSLDELPQLINVLKGEMSLVGPRPEMPFIVAKYDKWQMRRLDVLPGLTGLWQVVGRKNLPLHYNLEYDFYYIRNQSIWLDISILARTAPAVIFGKGAF